jgi:carboxylesterase type B
MARPRPQGKGEEGESLSEDCLFLNVWTPAKAGKKPAWRTAASGR